MSESFVRILGDIEVGFLGVEVIFHVFGFYELAVSFPFTVVDGLVNNVVFIRNGWWGGLGIEEIYPSFSPG